MSYRIVKKAATIVKDAVTFRYYPQVSVRVADNMQYGFIDEWYPIVEHVPALFPEFSKTVEYANTEEEARQMIARHKGQVTLANYPDEIIEVE